MHLFFTLWVFLKFLPLFGIQPHIVVKIGFCFEIHAVCLQLLKKKIILFQRETDHDLEVAQNTVRVLNAPLNKIY